MTSPVPTVQVLLDDGTGTYPTDVSPHVSLAQLAVQGYGRTDEFTTANAASLTLSLKNDDGSFSSGSGSFGGGGFGGGGFGGGVNIYPGQGIRLKTTVGATTRTWFTGVLAELDLTYSAGPALASEVGVTAVDPLARLANTELRSMLEQEILLDSPTAYYTLGEAEGSTSAGDTSGNQSPPLTIAGTGTALTFGTGIGPVDGLSATQFFGGKYLSDGSPTVVGGSSTTFSACVAFNTSTIPATASTILAAGGWFIYIDTAGHLAASAPGYPGITSADVVADGLTHFAVATGDGTTATLYLDGTPVATGTPLVAGDSYGFAVGGGIVISGATFTVDSTPFTGTISHAASFATCLSSTQVTGLYTVAASASETTADRFDRLASYAGATVSTPSNSGQLMAAQTTSGGTAFDALEAVALAEGGVFFADGTGTLVLQGRGYRAAKTTADLTVSMKDVDPSTAMTLDTQQIVNRVDVTRTGGANQRIEDTTSQGTYGLFATSLDLAVADDASAQAAAQWDVAAHAAPVKRMGAIQVDLLTSPDAENITATEIGDRWALSDLPSQVWTDFGDLVVEGWSMSLAVAGSSDSWSLTLNLLPWSLFTALVLDDATYGALDSYPIMN